jgi:hypothetical protein
VLIGSMPECALEVGGNSAARQMASAGEGLRLCVREGERVGCVCMCGMVC